MAATNPKVRRRKGRPPKFPPDVIGMRFGKRRIIAELPRVRHIRRVRVICDCGRVSTLKLPALAQTRACRACSAQTRRPRGAASRTDMEQALAEAAQRCPEVWLDDSPESLEPIAELVFELGPFTLQEIGALLGVTRERIRQIQDKALARLRQHCVRAGLSVPEESQPGTWELAELEGWAA